MRDRPTVRVLLLSPERRLLLLYCHNRLSADPPKCWITPGGGIEPGETIEQAVRREMREETGICALEVGPVVWTHDLIAPHYGEPTRFCMSFVTAFAQEQAVDFGGALDDEKADLLDARWWSLEDLRASQEPMFPLGLAELIAPVMAGRYPDSPVVMRPY